MTAHIEVALNDARFVQTAEPTEPGWYKAAARWRGPPDGRRCRLMMDMFVGLWRGELRAQPQHYDEGGLAGHLGDFEWFGPSPLKIWPIYDQNPPPLYLSLSELRRSW